MKNIRPRPKTPKKPAPTKAAPKPQVALSPFDRRREWRFRLPLQAVVQGHLPRGEKFQEEAMIENISSTGAYFCLNSGVVVGTKLNLWIDVPKEAGGGRKVRIQIGGLTIRLEKPDIKGKRQGVAVRFSKGFKFVGSK